ncbi:MAG: flagellar export chaperone FlgN [Treponema sp.]|nr:flagellar export chaperone FlgN [Treponema sp.]
MNLTQEQLDERIAILKRFRTLLQQQRNKFQEYLNVLEKQQDKIECDDGDAIIAHAELETQIVANIASLQKVIAPMQDMYNAVAVGPGIPVADGMSVEKMQAELASLQQKVLIQNERNRSLLRAHITQIRGQLAGMNAMNPYRGRTSVYAERGAVSSSVVLEA